MTVDMLIDAILDAGLDTLKLFPFLFATYIFMEWLEHAASSHFVDSITKASKFGPAVGALLGVVPQCGFSGAAATLYAARVISLGTLVSIFLAPSDEMLPIMISCAVDPIVIAKVLVVKVVVGVICGFVLNAILTRLGRFHAGFAPKQIHAGHVGNDIKKMCEEEGCLCNAHCDHEAGKHAWGHIAFSAFKHSVQIAAFVLIITFCINLLVDFTQSQDLVFYSENDVLLCLLASVIGLIPNCAVSVGLTELYLNGFVSCGAMIAGLLSNAGIGLLVLLRTNSSTRENLRIAVLLVVVGFLCGSAISVFGLI